MISTQTLIRASKVGILATALTISLAGCASSSTKTTAKTTEPATNVIIETPATTATQQEAISTIVNASTSGVIDTTNLFTDRDLSQVADTQDATSITVASGQDVQITQEGVYVISGEATEATITVDVDSSEKVQLVLDGVSITNENSPAIYVKSADKVFVTTVEGTINTLQVTGSFVADGDTNTDAVIFSKDDLVLNGLGTLKVSSTGNGISCKDDLKVTGGSYEITCEADALEANDSIAIADGTFVISTSKDGLHAENDEDDSVGFIYLYGGNFDIEVGSDGIQATTYIQIDGGTYTINAGEALEATYVQVNGGDLNLSASDDGINGSYKSSSVGTPTIEITGGELAITMGSGDTDALDVNGNLIVTGGTIDISAQFAFDFDGTSTFTGGTITVNGEQVTEISNSMMMGSMGQMGGLMGQMMSGERPQEMGQMGGSFQG